MKFSYFLRLTNNNNQIIADQKQSQEGLKYNKQSIVNQWMVEQFRAKLKKVSMLTIRKDKPFILYNNIIEESEHAVQEELITVSGKYVIVQLISRGGFIPTNFQRQRIFTVDKFCIWVIKQSRDMVLQCFDNLAHIDY
jgi:hypothetical protein